MRAKVRIEAKMSACDFATRAQFYFNSAVLVGLVTLSYGHKIAKRRHKQ